MVKVIVCEGFVVVESFLVVVLDASPRVGFFVVKCTVCPVWEFVYVFWVVLSKEGCTSGSMI